MTVSTRALRDKRAMVASEISNGEAMGFNLWLVIFLGLMPAFSLFTGLSVASGFQSAADWSVIGTLLATALVTGYLAKRRADEISKETSNHPISSTPVANEVVTRTSTFSNSDRTPTIR